MKPPPFAYAAPASVAEARRAAGRRRGAGAGRRPEPRAAHERPCERPSALVDINRIAELAGLEVNGDVIAGATVRADRLARDPSVAARLPVLADAAARVGHPAVRNRGTVGGNLAFADPANNLPVVALLLEASLTVRSVGGERTVDAAEFFRGAYTTALEDGELLCRVRFPGLPMVPAARTTRSRRARAAGGSRVPLPRSGLARTAASRVRGSCSAVSARRRCTCGPTS